MATTQVARLDRLPTESQTAVSGLSLRRNVAWTLLGNTAYAASQWAILIAIAKVGDVSAVGRFALALAVTGPVFVACNLQLRSVQSSDVRQEFAFGELMALRILAAAGGMALVCLIGLAYGYEQWLCIAMIGAAKAVECVIDIVCGVFQSRERMDLVTRSLLFRSAISLITIVACAPFSPSVAVWTTAILFSRLIVLFAHDLPQGRKYSGSIAPQFDWSRIALLARLTWPLGLVTLIASLNVNIPRYQIERSLGMVDLGVFSALSYMLVLASMMTNAIGQSAMPRLSSAWARGDRRLFLALSGRLTALAAAAGAVLVLAAGVAGPQALHLLYGPAYAARPDVLTALAGAMAVSLPASVVNYSSLAARQFKVQLPLALSTAAVTSVMSLWLIPRQGLLGAPVALGAGSAVQLGLTWALLAREARMAPVTGHEQR
jgi:O-antigen/teichoic acid export membrane protein